MTQLWDYFDGEPFLDNPSLFILPNKRRRKRRASKRSKSIMARRRLPGRDARGRFKKRGSTHKRRRVTATKRKVTRRRRPAVAVAVANPRRRRRTYHAAPKRRRRSYRRNPSILGVSYDKSILRSVGFTVVGVAGTPFLEGFLQNTIVKTIGVTDPTIQKVLNYGLKVGSAFGVSWGVKQVAGRDAGRYALVGGLAYVAVAAIRDLFPTLLGSGTGKYLSAQPLLGRYQTPRLGGNITRFTPERLRPQTRM